VPERLTDEEFSALLREEKDVFRLIIRGWAAIEADLNAYAAEAFTYPLDVEFARLAGVRQRIAIAAALGVVPAALAPALNAIATLRNEFSHGDRVELTVERAASFREVFREWLSDGSYAVLEQVPPIYTVVYALNVARVGTRVAVGHVRERLARDAVLAELLADRTRGLGQPQIGSQA
jgi:hypothetical protein